MNIEFLSTENTNNKYYKIIETNTYFAGTKLTDYAGKAGALKLTDKNGNVIYAGTYSEKLNSNIYESAISVTPNINTSNVILGNNSQNNIIVNITKNNSLSTFTKSDKNNDNKIVNLVLNSNQDLGNLSETNIQFSSNGGALLFNEKYNGINGILLDNTRTYSK